MSLSKRLKLTETPLPNPILKKVSAADCDVCIDTNKFTIGRGLGNSKVIIELSVSRNHCTFIKNPSGDWSLTDHGSTYGTFVNGVRIKKDTQVNLKHGDRIRLGSEKSMTYIFKLSNVDVDCDESAVETKTKKESSLEESLSDIEKKLKRTTKRHSTMVLKKESLENKYSQMMADLDKSYVQKKLENKNNKDWEAQKKEIEIAISKEKQKLKDEFTKEIDFLQEKINESLASENVLAAENRKLTERLEAERMEFNKRLEYERLDFTKRLEYEKVISGSEQARTLKLIEEKVKIESKLKKQLKEAKKENKTLAAQQSSLQCTVSQRTLRSASKQEQDMEARLKKLELELIEQDARMKKALEEKDQEKKMELEELKKLQDAEKCAIQLRLEEKVNEREKAVRAQLEDEVLHLINEKAELEKKISSEGKSADDLLVLRHELHAVNQNLVKTEGKKSFIESKFSQVDSSKSKGMGSLQAKESILSEYHEVAEMELQCSICNELFVVATTLNCSHTFCKSCIDQWKQQKKQCPICRKAIKSENRSLVLDNFIDKIISNSSESVRNKRQELIETRSVQLLFNEPSTSNARTRNSARGRRPRTAVQATTTTNVIQPIIEVEQYELDRNLRNMRQSTISVSDSESDTDSIGDFDSEDGEDDYDSEEDMYLDYDPFRVRRRRRHYASTGVYVEGVPGHSFGGYGFCFTCGAEGHWAPGCPRNN